MKTFAELTKRERAALIERVTEVLAVEFKLNKESISGFWQMVAMGILRTEKA